MGKPASRFCEARPCSPSAKTAELELQRPFSSCLPIFEACRRLVAPPSARFAEVRVFVNGVYTLKQSKNLSALGLDQRGPRSPSVGDSVNHERRTLNSRRLEVNLAYSR